MDEVVLVVGGGIVGARAAQMAAAESLYRGASVAVTLVSPLPYTTARPRLYERDLSTVNDYLAETVEPLGVRVIPDWVESIDLAAQRVATRESGSLSYDRLVLAMGSVPIRPPIPGSDSHGFDIETYESADKLRRHLEAAGDGALVVVGAGFTGLEVVTALAGDYPDRPVILVARSAVGTEFGTGAQRVITAALDELGVQVRTGISAVDDQTATFVDGGQLRATAVIWCTGVRAHPLAAQVAEQAGAATDNQGRVVVTSTLAVPGAPGVYAAGDCAHVPTDGPGSQPAMMSCQHGIPQAGFAGANPVRSLLGLPEAEYHQRRYVTCMDLGDAGGFFTTGWDRQLLYSGREGKFLKKRINNSLAVPSGTREQILAEQELIYDYGDEFFTLAPNELDPAPLAEHSGH